MKALLDKDIVLQREASANNQDIGILFKWLDKGKYTKIIHPLTKELIRKEFGESLDIKLESYDTLMTLAPISVRFNQFQDLQLTDKEKNNLLLLNELYNNRVDLIISEDRHLLQEAERLGISESVFTIDLFLEKVVSEHPELINYNVLSVKQEYFGNININDSFFDSLKEDYPEFDKWFNKKANEKAYITYNGDRILSFLFLKIETKDENYSDIIPAFSPKKRLKIGTFKVVSNGVRLGERFLKIIFDNALQNNVDEIYVTIFDKRDEQRRLITLLEDWGFRKYGLKGTESVYVRTFIPTFNRDYPRITYPYISDKNNIFLVPIYPQYHTELLPDSYLNNESPEDFKENQPHRNAISKVYICRSIERNVKNGDILIFYRTAPNGKSGYYSSVITTIGLVEEKIDNIQNEQEFILKCRKRSIFTNEYLKEFWDFNPRFRPFIIRFMYVYSFAIGKRLNRQKLLELKIISGEENELRGLKRISSDQFKTIIKETGTNENIIID